MWLECMLVTSGVVLCHTNECGMKGQGVEIVLHLRASPWTSERTWEHPGVSTGSTPELGLFEQPARRREKITSNQA